MKRYRVPVEKYKYYGVYVQANSEEEAQEIVHEMIEKAGDLPACAIDDGADGDVRVVEDGWVDEINDSEWKSIRNEIEDMNKIKVGDIVEVDFGDRAYMAVVMEIDNDEEMVCVQGLNNEQEIHPLRIVHKVKPEQIVDVLRCIYGYFN